MKTMPSCSLFSPQQSPLALSIFKRDNSNRIAQPHDLHLTFEFRLDIDGNQRIFFGLENYPFLKWFIEDNDRLAEHLLIELFDRIEIIRGAHGQRLIPRYAIRSYADCI